MDEFQFFDRTKNRQLNAENVKNAGTVSTFFYSKKKHSKPHSLTKTSKFIKWIVLILKLSPCHTITISNSPVLQDNKWLNLENLMLYYERNGFLNKKSVPGIPLSFVKNRK